MKQERTIQNIPAETDKTSVNPEATVSAPDRKQRVATLLLLHGLLLVYSLGGICSKLAAQSEFLSLRFFLLYGAVLLILAIYALVWQQILKRLPLVTAYANKAVTVLWGLLWGLLFFGETITVQKALGAAVIICGIILVVKEDA